MTVIQYKKDGCSTAHEYLTDITDIRQVADKYGETDDVIKLYDDNDNLVAVAVWPLGYAVYAYKWYDKYGREIALQIGDDPVQDFSSVYEEEI